MLQIFIMIVKICVDFAFLSFFIPFFFPLLFLDNKVHNYTVQLQFLFVIVVYDFHVKL